MITDKMGKSNSENECIPVFQQDLVDQLVQLNHVGPANQVVKLV